MKCGLEEEEEGEGEGGGGGGGKDKPQIWRIYLQKTHLIKDCYPKYTKGS